MAEHFPKDAWYAVGGAAMLAEGEVMPVKLFGEERVAWRGDDGESHVWHNRCIHRGMRLQYGFVDGDRLACRYHGWRFGGDAQCKKIPAQPTMAPPDDFRIPVFQSAEKNGLVWTTAGTPGANVTGLPGSENFVFCRSLAVHAPPDAVVEHFGNMDASITTPGILSAILNIEGADVPVAVAIQPVSADKSQIHVTAGQAGAENAIQPLRLRVSAWARRLRDTIENQTEKEASE